MTGPLGLDFHIHFENQKSFLLELRVLQPSNSGKKNQFLYFDHIKKLAMGKEEELLKKLIMAQRKNYPFDSLDTLTFNKIELSLIKDLPLLKKIASLHKLFWKKKPLLLFSTIPKLAFSIEEKSDGTATVFVYFTTQGKKLEIEEIFLDAGFFIADQFIYEIEGPIKIDSYLSSYLTMTNISKTKKEDLIDELVQENIVFEIIRAKPLNKIPQLYLKDPRALFSEIGISYEGMGQFYLEDHQNAAIRDFNFEKGLVQDLKELGFVEKLEGFYLPLDRLEPALRFLLEMGWEVYDSQKRDVLINQKIYLRMGLVKTGPLQIEEIEVSSFLGEDALDLKTLSLDCYENQLFTSLSTSSVALIDPKLKEQIGPLLRASKWRGDKMILSKEQMGYALASSGSELIKKESSLIEFIGGKDLKKQPGSTFCGKLMPYQEKGLSWLLFLYEKGLSGILADEMGLGKTVQVLAFFSALEKKGPHLICVPASLIYNWQSEVGKFLKGVDVWIHHGTGRIKDAEGLKGKEMILVSYQTLRQDIDLFASLSFHTIVLDEATVIKNQASKVAKAVGLLTGRFRLCITATPLENRIEELFSLFTFLIPDLSASWKRDPLLLSQEIKPYLLRRLKSEVEIDLPEKIVQDVWVEMTDEQKVSYDNFISGKKDHLKEKNALEILTIILRLRQIAAHPALACDSYDDSIESSAKLLLLFQELEEIFTEKHKVIVYSQFTTLLKIARKEVEKRGYTYVYLDGKVPIKEREKRIAFFQETEENVVFLISLKAGGVGLNLTAADYVYLLDPWWNDKVEDQAIDRAHRIGQKRKVIAKRLYAKNSIEEKIQLLKQDKSSLFEAVIEGNGDPTPLEREDLLHLLDS